MMQIVYFSRKDQFLSEMDHVSGPKIYITPSPAKADGLRLLLQDSAQADVITIAKFTSELIAELWRETEVPKVKRKAELLLIFGILKEQHFPTLGFEQFLQAYNLFSDLRSFSMNQDALASVMEEQPQDVRQAVELFWKLLELTGFHDEHGAYHAVAEALRSGEERAALKKCYVFWGFQHLNGQQVDLLKALAIRYQVIIPFPLSIKHKLKRSDWLSWLKDSRCEERNLPELPSSPKAQWVKVNSRELSLNLRSLMKPMDQILLGVAKLTPSHLDLVPATDVAFKIPHQLVQTELLEIGYQLASHDWKTSNILELREFLERLRGNLLRGLGRSASFKQLKALELYLEALDEIQELTDRSIRVDRFLLKLLDEVVRLNQPRSSFIPMAKTHLSIDLRDMSSLDELKRNRRVVVCIDDRFDDVQGLGQNYSESIQRALAALGPLKRNELELHFRHWEFTNLFSDAEVVVLMAESTLKHSLVWKRLFSGIKLVETDSAKGQSRASIKDRFLEQPRKNFSGAFSASKFQTYQDCPRRFFYSYVDKLFPTVSMSSELDALAVGTISHKIIEEFYRRGTPLEGLPNLSREIMEGYLLEQEINLSPEAARGHELVFRHRSINGITFLKQLESLLGVEIPWKMEESFHLSGSYELRGKIDCMGITDQFLILLDFKSTKSSASSFKEIESYDSLQLWAYAIAASASIGAIGTRKILIGYVSLDNPSDSNLMTDDESLIETLKAGRLCRAQQFELPFSDALSAARLHIEELTKKILSDGEFEAKPRKPESCRYCELKKVCLKGEVLS